MNNNEEHNSSAAERESVKNLLTRLVAQFTAIVRDEIALVIQSLMEKSSDLRIGLILIAAALSVGFVASISLCAAIVIKLSHVVSPAAAAGMVGCILIAISLLLAFWGYKKIKSSVQ